MPNIPGPEGREYDFNPFILAAHLNKLKREQMELHAATCTAGAEYDVTYKPKADWYRNTLYSDVIQGRRVVNQAPHTIRVQTLINKYGESGYTTHIYSFKTAAEFELWSKSDQFDPEGYYRVNGPNVVLAYSIEGKFFGETGTHHANMFPGDRLFQLKATHGVPLEISLENLTRRGMVVDWVGFIKEARKSNWYDFQTLEVIQNALADVFDRGDQEEVVKRIKHFIMRNPISYIERQYPERVNAEQVGEILLRAHVTFNEFRASCRPAPDGMWNRDEVYEVLHYIFTTPVTKLP